MVLVSIAYGVVLFGTGWAAITHLSADSRLRERIEESLNETERGYEAAREERELYLEKVKKGEQPIDYETTWLLLKNESRARHLHFTRMANLACLEQARSSLFDGLVRGFVFGVCLCLVIWL